MSSPSPKPPGEQGRPRAGATSLGVLLREPVRRGNELLHERLAERGHPEVRVPHGNVLQFLDAEGTRVSELARRAQITKQSMAELVAHLEHHGYVVRVPDPADRRAKLVRPTTLGDEVYAIAREVVAELEDRLVRRLGADRVATLHELLQEVNAEI
jgi:DNA-binding MarR family transcriptional regulator